MFRRPSRGSLHHIHPRTLLCRRFDLRFVAHTHITYFATPSRLRHHRSTTKKQDSQWGVNQKPVMIEIIISKSAHLTATACSCHAASLTWAAYRDMLQHIVVVIPANVVCFTAYCVPVSWSSLSLRIGLYNYTKTIGRLLGT